MSSKRTYLVQRYVCPRFSLLYSILLQLYLLQHAPQTHAQNLTQQFDITKNHKDWDHRLRSVSTTSPIRTAIAKNRTTEQTLNETFDLIDTLYNVISTRRQTNHTNACNVHTGTTWSRFVRDRMLFFQIGEIGRDCYSSVNVAIAIKNGELKSTRLLSNARAILREGIETSFEATRNIELPNYNEDWRNPKAPFNMIGQKGARQAQVCSSESALAYRVRGEWYLRVVVTNRPPLSVQPDLRRHFLQEFVPRSGKHSLHMVHRQLRDENIFENSTTLTAMWGGLGVSVEQEKFDDELSPLGQAYRNNLVRTDLASDSVTFSNVAILALPMMLALVPSAFIANLNGIGMFAYTLVTDVFSTVPFLIKGIELVLSSHPNSKVSSASYAGDESLGAIQVWTVECAGKMGFRRMGIAFVVIALSVLVLGVAIEFWAKRVMEWKYRQSKAIGESIGPFGHALMIPISTGLLALLEEREKEISSDGGGGRGEQSIVSNSPVEQCKVSGPRLSFVSAEGGHSPFQGDSKTK